MRRLRLLALLILSVLVFCGGLILFIQVREMAHIVPSINALALAPTALVLGASVKQDGTASDALRDRVLTGVDVYKQGKASQLLMTGDDGAFHVNEVATMKRIAIEQGVPESAILVDGHGYRTYESCKRAVQVLHMQRAIIVTQRFHLSRALYLCSAFGMDTQGIAADRQTYRRILLFTVRDLLATFKAWWDIHIFSPTPPVSYTP